MAKEIERKFLLKKLPDEITCFREQPILQGYLAVQQNREIRLRRMGNRCFLTVKTGNDVIREELEISISRKKFNILWEGIGDQFLEKTRRYYRWKRHILEIDRYGGHLSGLITGEVEFPDEKKARDFVPPLFFREEITFDPRYKNRRLIQTPVTEAENLFHDDMKQITIGTIPYLEEDNDRKVVLVTRRNGIQWIFPKGQQEPNLSNAEVALLEADEEAGIKGEITGTPILVPYAKGDSMLNMLSFPVKVKELKKKWQEESLRDRKVVSIKEAYELSDQIGVHCGLKYLEILG